MKKIVFIQILCALAMSQTSIAQNTNPWPSNGNVGIGTTNPSEKLVVQESLGNDAIAIYDGLGSKRLGFGQESSYTGNYVDSRNIDFKIKSGFVSGTGGNIILMTQNGGIDNHTEQMRVDKYGNIGIATSNPAAKLHIGQSNQEIRFDYNGTNNYYGSLRWAGIQFGNNGSNRIVAGRTATGGLLDFYVNNTNEGADYTVTPNGILAMRINYDGNVGIGTTTPAEKLSVNGKIRAREMKVEITGWPDYVFEKDYELEKLEGLERFIKVNKHLPEMPSAKEAEKDGINLGEMNVKLLKKVEELTLHLIEQDKAFRELKASNEQLLMKVNQLELKH